MDKNSIEMLEFPRVRERLANYTSFSAGRELALSLEPVSDTEWVRLLLKQSAEARRLLSVRPDFHISEAFDVREDVTRAEKGVSLDAQTLLKISENRYRIAPGAQRPEQAVRRPAGPVGHRAGYRRALGAGRRDKQLPLARWARFWTRPRRTWLTCDGG